MRKIHLDPRYCESCKNEIVRNTTSVGKRISTKQYAKSRFCSIPCRAKMVSIEIVGSRNPNYRGGKNECIDCKKTLSVRTSKQRRCKDCYLTKLSKESLGNTFPNCMSCSMKTGDYNSIICKKCYRGELRPAWRGGISRLSSRIRGLPQNRKWQLLCMKRDGFSCVECGIVPKMSNALEVHHKKQFALILKENKINSLEDASNCLELWDIDNGETLCRKCHKLTDSYSKKL